MSRKKAGHVAPWQEPPYNIGLETKRSRPKRGLGTLSHERVLSAMTTTAPPVQQADTVFMAKSDTVDAPGDFSAGTGAINAQASGYEFATGTLNKTGLDSVNPLGWTSKPGVFKFAYADQEVPDEATEAAKPLDFHRYNMHPASHGMHPSQRVEIETVVVGEDRDEAFTSWASKEFSKGAVHKNYPYKKGKDGFAEGYSGYKPLWCAAARGHARASMSAIVSERPRRCAWRPH